MNNDRYELFLFFLLTFISFLCCARQRLRLPYTAGPGRSLRCQELQDLEEGRRGAGRSHQQRRRRQHGVEWQRGLGLSRACQTADWGAHCHFVHDPTQWRAYKGSGWRLQGLVRRPQLFRGKKLLSRASGAPKDVSSLLWSCFCARLPS